jgi:hypothetical protein
MAGAGSRLLPDSPVFRPRSTRCLLLSHPRRSEPNHGEQSLREANLQKSGALTAQPSPMRTILLQRDYPQNVRATRPNKEPSLAPAYHLALSLVRSLLPCSSCKQLRRQRSIVMVEPPIGFLPGFGPLISQLLAEVFTHQGMRVQLPRIMRVFPGHDSCFAIRVVIRQRPLLNAANSRRSACKEGSRNRPSSGPCGPCSGSRPSRTSKVRRRAISRASRSPFSHTVPSRGSASPNHARVASMNSSADAVSRWVPCR